jgi:hypothetical protein
MVTRGAFVVGAGMLMACGPAVGDASDGGSGSADGTAAGSSVSDTEQHAGSTSTTGDDGSMVTSVDLPRLDVAGADPKSDTCGIPRPSSCEPDWPAEAELAGSDRASLQDMSGETVVSVIPAPDEPDAEYIWALQFDLACPFQSQGPPDAADTTRFTVEGAVTISQHAGWEYTVVASYAAQVDVEFLNPCTHLLVHAIDVEPTPREPGGPEFAWDHLLRVGFVHAP